MLVTWYSSARRLCIYYSMVHLGGLIVYISTALRSCLAYYPPRHRVKSSTLHDDRGHCIISLPSISTSLRSGCYSGWPAFFLIWWWSVKWPACPHGGGAGREREQEWETRDFLTTQSLGLDGWYCIHTPALSTHPLLLFLLLLGPTARPRLQLSSAPWHCPTYPPCPWVNWDARNN